MRGSANLFAPCNAPAVRAPPQCTPATASKSRPAQLRHQQQRQQSCLRSVNHVRSERVQHSMATTEQSQSPASVDSLLAYALPSPHYIRSGGAAAVVALAAHSLMVEHGFRLRAQFDSDQHYVPPGDWNGKFQDEWVFEYIREACANPFVLHLSLQSISGRMFVQASEINNINNIQNLGLVPANYVPDAAKLEADSWAGVIQNEGQLRSFVEEYIAQPLAANATPAPPSLPPMPPAPAAAVGNVTEAADKGLVRPDSDPLSGLKQPLVLASVTVALAAVAVAWIVWSRSGRA